MNEDNNLTAITMPPVSRVKIWLPWLGGAIGLLLLGTLLVTGWRWYTSSTRIANALLADSQPNGELKNRQGKVEGLAIAEANANIHRVKYEADLPATTAGKSYHGWLYDPGTSQYRYAGQFYPFEQKRFALIFTTEENIKEFDGIVISLEKIDTPTQPTEIVAGGLLAVESTPILSEPAP